MCDEETTSKLTKMEVINNPKAARKWCYLNPATGASLRDTLRTRLPTGGLEESVRAGTL